MKLPGTVRLLLTSLTPQRRAPDPRHAIPEADKNLNGKTVAFIGGTDGMGRVALETLYRMGADVVLLARDEAKANLVLSALASTAGSGAISFAACDLMSMDSVRQCATRVLDDASRIDALVNCAGANFQDRVITSDGFERNWAVNYLGPFFLTNLLLERLKASAPSRIVNVSSATEAVGHINFQDLQFERGYSTARAYAQAKLALNMFTIDLARRLEGTGVSANSLNPGFIKSNLLRDLRGFEAIGKPMMQLLASPPEVGADRIVRLAISSSYEGVSGEYVYEDAIRPPNAETKDASNIKRLMRLSEEAVERFRQPQAVGGA